LVEVFLDTLDKQSLTQWHDCLEAHIQRSLKRAKVAMTSLPGIPLQLFLLESASFQQALDPVEVSAIFNEPAYWCFCWGSGYAQAQWLFEHPHYVKNKTVLDFGCGSGVVAIAAALLGAKRTIACDLDPAALRATAANAALNKVEIDYLDDFFKLEEPVDLILAADVLYDRNNHVLIDAFQKKAKLSVIADSRVKNFVWPGIEFFTERDGLTLPDVNEPDEFKRILFYRTRAC
jgi:predicted nicotinamide N-methyase